MTFQLACNCPGLISQGSATPKLWERLRRIARGGLAATVLLMGSALVVSSWMPAAVSPVQQQAYELYLQAPGTESSSRQDLSNSISPSTVLGGSLR